jgi:hypothetical protein
MRVKQTRIGVQHALTGQSQPRAWGDRRPRKQARADRMKLRTCSGVSDQRVQRTLIDEPGYTVSWMQTRQLQMCAVPLV